MEDNRAEQIEALEVLTEFNDRLVHDDHTDTAVQLDGCPCTGVLADDGAHGLVTVLLRLTAEAQFVLHQQGAGIVHAHAGQ